MNTRSRPAIVVLGSINMDLVVRCAQLPLPGETILAESSAEFCGGKGANQAVAASLAGGEVAMIGAIGSDAFASRLVGNLKRHDIGCERILHRDDMASGLAIISVDRNGQNSIIVVSGANSTLSPDDVIAAAPLIESADVLLLQLEIPMESVLKGIQIARKAGAKVLLDPAPAPKEFPDELLAVDLVCPNESEAAMLTGLQVAHANDAIRAAERLNQMGAHHVAITLGEHGTLLHSGGESRLIPPFPTSVVDTTAAGDSFAGALAVHWCRTDDLCDAICYANAAGALAASKQGAQASMATQLEIETLWRTRK